MTVVLDSSVAKGKRDFGKMFVTKHLVASKRRPLSPAQAIKAHGGRGDLATAGNNSALLCRFENGSANREEAGLASVYSPHFTPASEMLERARSKEAK